MSKRILSAVALSLVLATPGFAAPSRPAPNAGRGDDSSIGRTIRQIVRAIGHLIVSPMDDGPESTPPKP